ncbi:FAD-dependent oxidoreductase [Rouxiella sp. T17]|uniref:NAD(P)/FAD-dependent oxidoreductase n=1 Tax=Rouxiella sp. T17 TaxID=3085684 RepID=UPI002FC6C46B
MKIAIIGSGISGLSCAWKLSQQQPTWEVTLFEANKTLGGHATTVDVHLDGRDYALETAFTVYNPQASPHFSALLDQLGIEGQAVENSFSLHNPDTKLEFHSGKPFVQRGNMLKPAYWRFLGEIKRFNALCKARLQQPEKSEATLSTLLRKNGFSAYFALHYILPRAATIWSLSMEDMGKFPLPVFLRLFDQHGLFDDAPKSQAKIIAGGSREYIRRLEQLLPANVTLLTHTPVVSVTRAANAVTVSSARGNEVFDQVIFACHADQALSLLDTPTDSEKQVLGSLPYKTNDVVLHTDIHQLPPNRLAWASWNYRLPNGVGNALGQTPSAPVHRAIVRERPVSVTYNLNILQGIASPKTFCLSLNPLKPVDENKILLRTTHRHPVLNLSSLQSQRQRDLINGHNRSWFCGAYWHNGLHEDGVISANEVVNKLLAHDSA